MDEFVRLYASLSADEQVLVQKYIHALASGDTETCERMMNGDYSVPDKE